MWETQTQGVDHESTPDRRDTANDNAVPQRRRDRLQACCAAGRLAESDDSLHCTAAAAAHPDMPKESAPPPPDFAFYQKRGDAGLASSDYDAAIADYSKAIEMNPTWISSYLGRAAALTQKQAWVDGVLWQPGRDRWGNEVVHTEFARRECLACRSRPLLAEAASG